MDEQKLLEQTGYYADLVSGLSDAITNSSLGVDAAQAGDILIQLLKLEQTREENRAKVEIEQIKTKASVDIEQIKADSARALEAEKRQTTALQLDSQGDLRKLELSEENKTKVEIERIKSQSNAEIEQIKADSALALEKERRNTTIVQLGAQEELRKYELAEERWKAKLGAGTALGGEVVKGAAGVLGEAVKGITGVGLAGLGYKANKSLVDTFVKDVFIPEREEGVVVTTTGGRNLGSQALNSVIRAFEKPLKI